MQILNYFNLLLVSKISLFCIVECQRSMVRITVAIFTVAIIVIGSHPEPVEEASELNRGTYHFLSVQSQMSNLINGITFISNT